MLHQRAKELKLKEYDMKNFSGGKPVSSSRHIEASYMSSIAISIKGLTFRGRGLVTVVTTCNLYVLGASPKGITAWTLFSVVALVTYPLNIFLFNIILPL